MIAKVLPNIAVSKGNNSAQPDRLMEMPVRMTNQKSLSLDRTGTVLGAYKVYRGHKIAMHEDLFTYITSRMLDPATQVADELNRLVLQRYVSVHLFWFFWPLLGWGIGLASHAFNVFGKRRFLGEKWEARRMKQLMGEDE